MEPKRIKRFREVASKRQAGFVVVLEDIHDPHNAAAILRTCEAFGIQNVHFIFEQEKYYNPRQVGKVSSSSANKWLDFEIFRSSKACLKKLKRQKYEIVATALNPKAENVLKAKLTAKKIALVIGNEHRGVSGEVLKKADRILMLPMRGFVQSLNASVTAALFIYEISRQRAGNKKYRLNEAAQKRLVADFKKR